MDKYRKVAKENLTTQANAYKGICEVLRLIYDLVYTIEDDKLREEITERLIDAYIMAKKMNERLIYYKTTYNDTTGSGGKNIERLSHSGGLRTFRKLRQPK